MSDVNAMISDGMSLALRGRLAGLVDDICFARSALSTGNIEAAQERLIALSADLSEVLGHVSALKTGYLDAPSVLKRNEKSPTPLIPPKEGN